MSDGRGPLPQWDIVGREYEAKDAHGTVWRLWLVEQPADDDPLPPGYRLAPLGDPTSPTFVTGQHGLYHALDMAGMQISADAVRAEPEDARRQLGLDGA